LPLLYGIFPVLFLFAHNISELKYEMLWLPLAAIFFVILVSTAILSIFVKDYRKLGLILSLFFLFFLSYGNFKELLSGGWLEDSDIIRDRFLYPLGVLFFGLVGYFIMRAGDLKAIYGFFKTTGYALIAFSLINIGFSAYSNRQSDVGFWDSAGQTESDQNQNLPDIYYIIPDAYPRADILKEFLNYDNSEFVDFLEKKGFSVLSGSQSNYQNTVLSIPVTLNMDYLYNLLPETVKEDDFKNMVQNSRVQQFLKGRGYKIIYFNSGYGITSYNKYADIKFDLGYINDFSRQIIETSLLKYFVIKKQFFGISMKNEERKRILRSFEKLKEIPEIKTDGPKFVFIHINSPHTPFLFDRGGGEVNVDYYSIPTREKFNDFLRDQIMFINGQLSSVVDEILAKSETEPIVIIQSDHGFEFFMTDMPDGFFESDAFNRARIKNLSAFYLPGNKKTLLPNNMTNVNTFRFIFKNYFNADYDLLEDKVYKYFTGSFFDSHADLRNIEQVPKNLF